MDNYDKLGGRETSISDLNLMLKEGETRYPVIISGDVHCWDEEGKAFETRWGDKACYERICDQNYWKIFERKLDFVIRDKKDRDMGVNVPWKNLFWENDLYTNIYVTYFIGNDTWPNHHYYVPHNSPVMGIGKIQKRGKSLFLTPDETIPNSLFIIPTDDPRRVLAECGTLKSILNMVSFSTLTVGFSFLGLGYWLRVRSRRNNNN